MYKPPKEFEHYLGDVMSVGAKKYGDDNWKQPNGHRSSFYDMIQSMQRHLLEAASGKTKDEDTGCHPLAHLATRALMLLWRVENGLASAEEMSYTVDYLFDKSSGCIYLNSKDCINPTHKH